MNKKRFFFFFSRTYKNDIGILDEYKEIPDPLKKERKNGKLSIKWKTNLNERHCPSINVSVCLLNAT